MTLKEIADLAGVSIMTVSNVINGKHNRVSEKTIEKVNAIIRESGYVPNLNARSLTSKSSNIIQIIISADEADGEENYLENPYISSMVGTIEKELRHSGYYTMVRSVSKKTDVSALLKNWNMDGIIFLYPHSDEYLKKLAQNISCPIAVFDSNVQDDNIITVSSDDEKGLYLSTKYLINRGHKQIAFVADYEGNGVLTTRFHGYCRALAESDIPYRPELVFSNPPSYEGGIAAGKRIASCQAGITAVVTTADICAIGVMEGARLEGCRIPVDLSIIGYDNLNLCQYTTPKLTSVSQNITQKAVLATQLLLERIQTGTNSGSFRLKTDVEIVERQSAVSLFL